MSLHEQITDIVEQSKKQEIAKIQLWLNLEKQLKSLDKLSLPPDFVSPLGVHVGDFQNETEVLESRTADGRVIQIDVTEPSESKALVNKRVGQEMTPFLTALAQKTKGREAELAPRKANARGEWSAAKEKLIVETLADWKRETQWKYPNIPTVVHRPESLFPNGGRNVVHYVSMKEASKKPVDKTVPPQLRRWYTLYFFESLYVIMGVSVYQGLAGELGLDAMTMTFVISMYLGTLAVLRGYVKWEGWP